MADTQPLIGIVTVLYNSGTVVDEFFETLDRQTYRNFILYVVDNCSPDDSLDKARAAAARCSFKSVVFAEAENWGVAKGNNIGIRAALAEGCQYVLLSNNDAVLEPSTLEMLYQGLREHHAQMAVPKIYFHDSDLLWACGAKINRYSGRTPHFGYKKTDNGQYDIPAFVGYSPTCFMLIERDVFDRVGLMDERYFVYWDDTDFVFRATQLNHQKLVYIPASRLWHKESTSTQGARSDFSIRYYHRNLVYMANKLFTPFQKESMLCYAKLRLAGRRLLGRISKAQYRLAYRSLKEGDRLYWGDK